MSTIPKRRLLLELLALAFAGLAAGCHGGGGPAVVREYFGTNNIRECEPIEVDVDLAKAEAVLALRTDGSVDCVLDAALAGDGCDILATVSEDGATLRVSIGACEVPPVANLFHCGFTRGDLSALRSATRGFCTCVGEPACRLNIYCDPTPGICVNGTPDPGACEDCFNGKDDDGNGNADCWWDQNCHVEDCGYGQSTVTCTYTTTTSTSTTATSTPAVLLEESPPPAAAMTLDVAR